MQTEKISNFLNNIVSDTLNILYTVIIVIIVVIPVFRVDTKLTRV